VHFLVFSDVSLCFYLSKYFLFFFEFFWFFEIFLSRGGVLAPWLPKSGMAGKYTWVGKISNGIEVSFKILLVDYFLGFFCPFVAKLASKVVFF
jgi:hypothetical protein